MRLSVKYINFIWPTCCWENFSWQHSHVACKIVKPGWGVSMSCCETVNYQILYLSLRHHSACASITVQKSEHFHVPVYQRLREDQFHAPIDQLCREVHGNFHVPFDQLCREVYGNFHVPFEQLCLGIHGNIHVPFWTSLSQGTWKFPCFFWTASSQGTRNFPCSFWTARFFRGTRKCPSSFCKHFVNKLFLDSVFRFWQL